MQRVGAAIIAATVAAAIAAAPARGSIIRAESSLPPGESGFVSIPGVASGTGSPHLYDQNDDYIHFRYKNAQLGQPGSAETPMPGVTIVRDAFGVPSITGSTASNLWWGAGYATAQDRLFQLELFRRATTGHLAEILGKSYIPMDLQVRRDFYTTQELDSLISRLAPQFVQRYRDYAAGINAWVSHAESNPSDLPGEFAALADPPRPFTPLLTPACTTRSRAGCSKRTATGSRMSTPETCWPSVRSTRSCRSAPRSGQHRPALVRPVPVRSRPHAQAGARRAHALGELRPLAPTAAGR